MRGRSALSFPAAAGGFALLIVLMIWRSEGAAGFKPFANLEALLVVCAGAFAALWTSYPLPEVWRALIEGAAGAPAGSLEAARRRADILRAGADAAVAMGGVGAVFGVILLLSSIEDVAQVPRRMALALTALFYGMALSEGVFMPLARRALHASAWEGAALHLVPRRLTMALIGGGTATMAFWIILYALTAALYR